MNSVIEKCYAKINLSLDAIEKRPDGYHNVELILNEISLYDTLCISVDNNEKINLKCSDKTLPEDSSNIAYKAAELFLKKSGLKYGVSLDLTKRIPHGAGLAGGSADAAGVLRGLNNLSGNFFSHDELMSLAAQLGADVPFCISGGCAFAEGIGDKLTQLPVPQNFHYVIVKPEESISTAYVYNNLDLKLRKQDINVRAAAEALKNNDREAFLHNAGNFMETVTAKKFPVINDIKNQLRQNGAFLSMMSGSGTSVFGIFETCESAKKAAAKLNFKNVYIV